MDYPTALAKVRNLLLSEGVKPDSAPETELRQKAKLAYGVFVANQSTDPDAREVCDAWRRFDAVSRLHGTDPFAWHVARELSPRAQYEEHMAAEEAQRVMDFAGTDPALGRFGVPMTGKYEPRRDNRDEQPRVRNSEGG